MSFLSLKFNTQIVAQVLHTRQGHKLLLHKFFLCQFLHKLLDCSCTIFSHKARAQTSSQVFFVSISYTSFLIVFAQYFHTSFLHNARAQTSSHTHTNLLHKFLQSVKPWSICEHWAFMQMKTRLEIKLVFHQNWCKT